VSRRLQLSMLIAILIILVALLFYFLIRMEEIQLDRRDALTQAVALASEAAGLRANALSLATSEAGAAAQRATALAGMEAARQSAEAAGTARETAIAMAVAALTSEAGAHRARETAVAQANIAAEALAEVERARREAEAAAESAFATGTPLALALATEQRRANDYFATAQAANALLQLFETDVQLDITPMEFTAVPTSMPGPLYVASGLDAQGCPVEIRQVFSPDTPVIYAVSTNTPIRAGTTIFARWYRNSEVYRDSPAFTADRDYPPVCVAFSLEPDPGKPFEAGLYRVEFVVDGASVAGLSFLIENSPT